MKKLYPEERLLKIMELLKARSKVEVETLTDYFQVTGSTIRADLRELEDRHLIVRTHGGAMLKEVVDEGLKPDHDPAYARRLRQHHLLKAAIGKATASLLADGESMMLDDGSTTLQVAKHFPPEKRFKVVTNGLNICLELANHPNVHVVATGGTLKKEDLSYHGRVAEDVAARFNTDKSILGASGIAIPEGVTAPNEEKAELKKIMISHSRDLILVADHTKLMRVSFVPVCRLESIHTLVTDSRAPAEVVARFRDYGVEVVIAE